MNDLETLLALQECQMLINDIEEILNIYSGKFAIKKALTLIELYRKGKYLDV